MNVSKFSLLTALLGGCFLASCGSVQEAQRPIQYMAGLAPVNPGGPVPGYNPQFADAYWDGDGVTGAPKIVIDLSDQKARFYKGSTIVGVTPVSTGDATHRTPTGNFRVTEMDADHRSSCYGAYVDEAGNVVKADIDNRKDRRPPGTKYLGADMQWFLRFNHGIGMHAGHLPGYPASHGCVRQPEHMARVFYENAKMGMPVKVQH